MPQAERSRIVPTDPYFDRKHQQAKPTQKNKTKHGASTQKSAKSASSHAYASSVRSAERHEDKPKKKTHTDHPAMRRSVIRVKTAKQASIEPTIRQRSRRETRMMRDPMHRAFPKRRKRSSNLSVSLRSLAKTCKRSAQS